MEFAEMLSAVQAFHDKFEFKANGGEDMLYRMNLLIEELGEIAACLTKGKPAEQLAEEHADLLILLLGNAISAGIDLESAFREKMERIMTRPVRRTGGTPRVTEYRESEAPEKDRNFLRRRDREDIAGDGRR